MTRQDITPSDSIRPVYLEPLTEDEISAREAETQAHAEAKEAKAAARQALLTKLGITEEEAQLLLGGN